MATTHPSSRMSRLGLFSSKTDQSKPGQSSLAREPEEPEEDWYIPYNGPYEPPKRPEQEEDRDSWGELLNGWLSEDESGEKQGVYRRDGRGSHAASAPDAERSRSRVVSNTSRHTNSTNGGRAPQPRSNVQPRMPTMSYINLDQTGGIGDSPMPPERTPTQRSGPSTTQQPQQPSALKRGSLASIFTFGRKSLRLSVSMDNMAPESRRSVSKRDRSNTEAPLPSSAPPIPRGRQRAHTSANTAQLDPVLGEDDYYNSYYSTLLATPRNDIGPSAVGKERSHPYAYPFPEATTTEPRSAPATVDIKGKGRLLNSNKISFTLLDSRGAKGVPAYLKPSPRNSLLKASISAPNLRTIPKGKQRWWAAETWCDAIMLPRPRFAMRLMDEEGRIISPSSSPIMSRWSPDASTSTQRKTDIGTKSPTKKSAGNLAASAAAGAGEASYTAHSTLNDSKSKPPRPKSFALDDLALPSPVPSLTKVLEEGRQLEQDRKQWQSKASRSYLDNRAGIMSRARSKSIGAQGRPRLRSKEPEGAFELFTERTLLGGQTRPPTIHVRGPSVSKVRVRSQSQTQSATAQGTVQSTISQVFSRSGSRTRSHAHSNSVGNSTHKSTSDGSGSGGGHSRSQSVGKSALRMVVSSASNAAVFCGLGYNSDRGTLTPLSEKETAMEGALRNPGTKIIHLQDQIQPGGKGGENDNLVVLSSPSAALAMVNRSGMNGVSPTPSALSGSGEGVGIAISSPSEELNRQLGREPIRIPTHPYAQSFSYAQRQPVLTQSPESYHFPPSPPAPAEISAVTEEHNKQRQPIIVHPYAQPGHPYAAAPSQPRYAVPQHLKIPPRVPNGMFVEFSPGHVREFAPGDLQYSPDIPTPTVVQTSQRQPLLSSSSHPYAPASKRMSELGFGEALMHTMRRTSTDSGLGISEPSIYGTEVDWERPVTDVSPGSAADDIALIHGIMRSSSEPTYLGTGKRPATQRDASGGVLSNNTLASSPPEHVNPPDFRRTASAVSGGHLSFLAANSSSGSGSSPGMISHDSSPPLSPHPINTNEDLERFRDLFYRPRDSQSIASLDDFIRPALSHRPSSGIPIDVSSESSRSALTRSGLSDLARQLSEDLEELRQERGSGIESEVDLPPSMWGRRYGGLRGPRPDDMTTMDDPNVVLAQLTSTSGSPEVNTSPLRLPIDTSFVSPITNIPEDVESSRTSSILELSPFSDETAELVRLGAIEAVSTPPIISTPQRFSTELSLFHHGNNNNNRDSDDAPPVPSLSQRSTLLTPLSPNTRSSYMTSNTDTSRMSGLSDFPAPPTQVMPPSSQITTSTSNLNVPPRLVREFSHGTFGRRDDEHSIVGEAL